VNDQLRTPRSPARLPVDCLTYGWSVLRLAAEVPDRIAGWDAIVLTAAGEQQAELFRWHLEASRNAGHIPAHTQMLVAADPEGVRIGSGGATLNALRAVAGSGLKDPHAARILVIHSGGESRRIPWAAVCGKAFVPLPLLGDPDGAVPTLLDQLLAVMAPLPARMERGGIAIMAGDVLPLFAGASVAPPLDGGLVLTTPVPLDVAQRHGVIVPGEGDKVARFLQKVPADQLADAGGAVGGAALVDTGIYLFTGRAQRALVQFAASEGDPVARLAADGRECSLYEEIAPALVPAHHAALSESEFGRALVAALGKDEMFHRRMDDMAFVHVGTTTEFLEWIRSPWEGLMERRVLAECAAALAESVTVAASAIDTGAQVGGGSLVYGSRLGASVRVGARCLVAHADLGEAALALPDGCCLWQVPVAAADDAAQASNILLCCGVDDDPKLPLDRATFCGAKLTEWLSQRGIGAEELWQASQERTLWTARLFPAGAGADAACLIEWMLGEGAGDARELWLRSRRLSLAEVQDAADLAAFRARMQKLCGELAARAIRQTAEEHLDRNVHRLASHLTGTSAPDELGALAVSAQAGTSGQPASRLLQLSTDLMEAAGCAADAEALAARAFQAVQREVEEAVSNPVPEPVSGLAAGRRVEVGLPVRFDFAGGWSDTPPYCLERPAKVLNLAVALDEELPVGASAESLAEPRWELAAADIGQETVVHSAADMAGAGGLADPFALARTALLLTGYGSADGPAQGVRVRTWSTAPRGSGLGASSVVAAALCIALQRLAGRPDDVETISDLVLNLEQRMSTGGGWQDQIGGLVPGAKCITSAPTRPLSLTVDRIALPPEVQAELEQRFVIAFTGKERLAKNILQIIVKGYLRRDRRVLSAIEELVELAGACRDALAAGELTRVGRLLSQVWRVHQQLDPHSSTPEIDAIFHAVQDYCAGGKLAGAGGGGFIGLMARDAAAAERVRAILNGLGGGVRVHDWKLWTSPPQVRIEEAG